MKYLATKVHEAGRRKVSHCTIQMNTGRAPYYQRLSASCNNYKEQYRQLSNHWLRNVAHFANFSILQQQTVVNSFEGIRCV